MVYNLGTNSNTVIRSGNYFVFGRCCVAVTGVRVGSVQVLLVLLMIMLASLV